MFGSKRPISDIRKARFTAARQPLPARAAPADSPFLHRSPCARRRVQILLGRQPLQPCVLSFQGAKTFDIAGRELTEVLAPAVDGLLADLAFPRSFGHRRPVTFFDSTASNPSTVWQLYLLDEGAHKYGVSRGLDLAQRISDHNNPRFLANLVTQVCKAMLASPMFEAFELPQQAEPLCATSMGLPARLVCRSCALRRV
jgi:hypothetical protein